MPPDLAAVCLKRTEGCFGGRGRRWLSGTRRASRAGEMPEDSNQAVADTSGEIA
jgi:hypothetical protein